MSARSGIVAGGNWIIDRLKFIDVYPEQDALANIITEAVGNGGSPFNILVDLAKLGASFPLAGIGLIGDDSNGKWVAEQCRLNRVNVDGLQIHPTASTSYTDVMTVQTTGRRTFFHQRGANAFLDEEHFEFKNNTAKIFHLGYLLLLDRMDHAEPEFGTVAARTLFRATEAGYKTSIDVVSEDSDRFAKVVLPALRHVDYCILNEFELGRTTGMEIRGPNGIDLKALRGAAHQLLEAGVREWVIVHFPEGACALGHDGKLRAQGSLQVPQEAMVSTVGAGDAFAAGVLYGLHEEASIEAALRDGTCAAAACLRGAGTSDGILPLDECLELANRFGFRSPPAAIDK